MHNAPSPSFLRQSIAELLRDDPALVFEWSAHAGGPTIDKSLEIRSVETEYADPHEPGKVHRTDVVFVAYAKLGGFDVPIHAVVVEILDCKDPSRPPSWRVFPEAVLRRHGCRGQVVIFAIDPEVRAWAGRQALH